jgi:tRNA pseudouridine55 synthase
MTQKIKANRKIIDGLLIIDKSSGPTSNRVLQNVKRLYNAAKAGHTGSLDPLASGVLPICFGKATKVAQKLLDADKTYLVTAKLGIVTDSGDSEGTIIAQHPVPELSTAQILAQIDKFIGPGQQVPSMFSALKHKGQPLYKLARQNIVVDRPPRDIIVYQYKLLAHTADTLTCEIKCSKGTYIRTLIEDLGMALGCGAHVIALRRTQAGPFTLEQATTVEALTACQDPQALEHLLLPVTSVV